MDEAKIKEIFSDEAFVKELLELDTPADVQAALKAKGIDMTEDEIVGLRDGIVKIAEKAGDGGELSLDELDEAAGGLVGTAGAIITTLSFITFGVTAGIGISAVGVAGAATLGTVGAVGAIGAIGSAIKNRRW